MKKINEIKAYAVIAITTLFINFTQVHAEGLDAAGLKGWVSSYITPLMDVLRWGIIPAGIIYAIVKGITWLSKESEGEQQKSYISTIKSGIIVVVIAESIAIILGFFGF